MQSVTQDELLYYRSEHWSALTHGIFSRKGGVSEGPFASLNLGGNIGDAPAAVRENHLRMFGALGLDDARACSVWQVHSSEVIVVTEPSPERRWIAQADGMVTDRPNLPLSMRFADCIPLLFYDRSQHVIGMAHAGWRGTVQHIGARTIQTMADAFGCRPHAIEVLIGPGISQARYQVGEEVVQAFRDAYGETGRFVQRDPHDGSAYLDLWAANALDLEQAGVEKIEVAGLCTASNTHLFFSHRAEHGKTGRFGAVMSL